LSEVKIRLVFFLPVASALPITVTTKKHFTPRCFVVGSFLFVCRKKRAAELKAVQFAIILFINDRLRASLFDCTCIAKPPARR
jgi:hypothetical protein